MRFTKRFSEQTTMKQTFLTDGGYFDLDGLLGMCEGAEPLRAVLRDHGAAFAAAKGSGRNHQAWEGGYLDHVRETMNIARWLYATSPRALPFKLSDALVVMFLHDVEKPFKETARRKRQVWCCQQCGLRDCDDPAVAEHQALDNWSNEGGAEPEDIWEPWTKEERREFRANLIARYGVQLTEEQQNALRYVEGVPDKEYTPGERTMGELAAFCHCCDMLSARLWHDKGKERAW